MFLPLLLALVPLLGPRGPWGGRPVLALGAVVPPSWADPRHNPCAAQPGGWQLLLWPEDGRCYRIFRRGPPCPTHMELTPGVGPAGAPGCRCPPGTATLAATATTTASSKAGNATCHALLEQGPCPHGQYLAPLPAPADSDDRVPHLRAACRAPDACPAGHVFWPRDGRCYPQLTRGPCYRGELLVAGRGSATTAASTASSAAATPLGACRCEARGELGRFYSPLTKTCHEHYTPGPCQEKGLIFLPPSHGGGAPRCGCSADLPHYHPATGQCFQIDTIGPCPVGHRFTSPGGAAQLGRRAGRAQCRCKGGHVPWPRPEALDGGLGGGLGGVLDDQTACYRPWTRGPCPQGQLLSDASQCVAAPCRPGRLYFPEDAGCYKVGVRGPCPKGQVVLFETAVRPALEGISYRGMCGCTGPAAKSSSNNIPGKAIEDNRCGATSTPTSMQSAGGAEDKDTAGAGVKRSATRQTQPDCEAKSGAIVFNGKCYSLYSQGPCPFGQWLVPQRRGREGRAQTDSNLELWSDPEARPRTRAKCDCRPGHKPVWVPSPNGNNATTVLECQPPTVVLASFLNARGFVTM